MSARKVIVAIGLTMWVALAFGACSSSDKDKNQNQGKSCNQARDCGEAGAAEWLCQNNLCLELAKYCVSPDECVNDVCENNQCTFGKKSTGGDEEIEIEIETETPIEEEIESEQVLCEYECCTNADCPPEWICSATSHKCVQPAPECEYECCKDQDCLEQYGEGYICIRENEVYTCKLDVITCSAGYRKCCEDDPGNPDCLALGTLKSEAILLCNAAGDGWDIEMCTEFNDCIGNGDGTVECFYNSRCDVTDDCQCPEQCLDVVPRKTCDLPTVGQDQPCYAVACDSTDPIRVAYCDDGAGLVCCVDQQAGTGTCVAESSCGK